MVDILSPLPGARSMPLLSAVSDGPEPAAPVSPAPPETVIPPPETSPAPVAVESVEPAATEEAPAQPEPEAQAETQPEAPPESPRQTRFAEYAKRTREAEARADRLAKGLEDAIAAFNRLTEQQQKAQEAQSAPRAPDRPTPANYPDNESYQAALVEWTATDAAARAVAEYEKRAEERRAMEENQRQIREAEAQRQQVADTWAARRAAAAQKYADFDEVIAASDEVMISDPMRDAILAADDGADITYYLGRNPQEAERIRVLPPMQQIIELGKLSAKLATPAPAPPRPPKLPPPITPVGNNTGSAERPVEQLSTEEYAARRMPKLQAERRASMFGQRP